MEIIEVKEEKKFNFEKVEFRKPKMKDLRMAELIAKATEGMTYGLAIISQVCTFDGKKYVMEDLDEMEADDFLELSQRLQGTNSMTSGNQSSSLPDTQDLVSNQS